MPQLGNRRVAERQTGIEIVEPAAAEHLLDAIVARRERAQRVIFFCACELPGTSQAPLCHRRVVAELVLAAAARRGIEVAIEEWTQSTPRGQP